MEAIAFNTSEWSLWGERGDYSLRGHSEARGETPGDGRYRAGRLLGAPRPRVRALRPDIDARLEAVVECCLEKDRERRFRCMAELRAALLPFASNPANPAGLPCGYSAPTAVPPRPLRGVQSSRQEGRSRNACAQGPRRRRFRSTGSQHGSSGRSEACSAGRNAKGMFLAPARDLSLVKYIRARLVVQRPETSAYDAGRAMQDARATVRSGSTQA
jgi:hypothetical protein